MTRTGMWMAGGAALSLLAGGLLLSGLGVSGACARARSLPTDALRAAPHTDAARTAAPSTLRLASTLPADTPLGSMLGVNEGMAIPAQLVRSRRLGAEAQRTELEDDARHLGLLGARLVRANSHTYPFLNFNAYQRDPQLALSYSDRYFAVLGAAGLDAVMVLGPWPGIQTANHTDRYLPDDMDAYAAFVRSIVERYDGDGVDDMPGLLRPARAWELDNEPDLHNAVRPRGARPDAPDPGQFETPAEYAEIVRVTAAAIRDADPDATILLGGMYNPRNESGRAYLEAVLAAPGVTAAFDVLSLHCYRDEDSLAALDETLQIAAAVAPDKPVWLTEISVSSVGRAPFQSEAWQARMVAAIYGEALASGVERVLWHTLADPPARDGAAPGGAGGEGPDLPFSHHSLYRTEASSWEAAPARVAKPSGALYARLSTHLDGKTRGTVQRAVVPDGRLVWVGAQEGLLYWGDVVLPETGAAWQVEDLLSGAVQTVAGGERVAAPAWIRPLRAEEPEE